MKIMKPVMFEDKTKKKPNKFEVKKDVVSEPKEKVVKKKTATKKTTTKKAPRKVAKKK